jgi:hypothetical protein
MAAEHRPSGAIILVTTLTVILIAYVLSEGPAAYGLARGWLSPAAHDLLYAPTSALRPESLEPAAERYPLWWYEQGERDRSP